MDGSRSARRGESDGQPHRSHSDRSKSRVVLSTSYPSTHARRMVMDRKAIAAIAGTVLIAALFITGAQPDYATVMARIKAIEGYTPLFQHAFPDEAEPITAENIG